MATKFNPDVYKSDEIILNTIYPYAGYTKKDLPTLLKAVRQGDLAVESILENAIAKCGNLIRCDHDGMDFTDGSDAKKAKVSNQGTIAKRDLAADIITKNKTGILRCLVVDPITETIHFFKVPPEFYNNGPKSWKTKIRIQFNNDGGKPDVKSGSIGEQIWSYEVFSFEELCC